MMEARLRELAGELGVEQNVLLAGWMDPREVLSVTREADIGMIPHLVTEHTDTTIPNKIFDYMANGLPVVVTHCSTLRSIVEETGCGRVCRDRDPQSMADAVLSLTGEAERRKCGEVVERHAVVK
jgi:glycosyltransferase involved in cell wall biosynthesis